MPRGSGLWPAFWMLGTDIDRASWPQTGEIDMMEHVGRVPNEVFGTLHGPGYSGGQSYGSRYDLGTAGGRRVPRLRGRLAARTRSSGIVDGMQYFEATPNDAFLQGKQWVFNHPFFMLLNVAVGGNFGGAVGPETMFPQSHAGGLCPALPGQARARELRRLRSATTSRAGSRSPFRSPRSSTATVPALDLTAIKGFGFLVPGGMRSPLLHRPAAAGMPGRCDRDQHSRQRRRARCAGAGRRLRRRHRPLRALRWPARRSRSPVGPAHARQECDD